MTSKNIAGILNSGKEAHSGDEVKKLAVQFGVSSGQDRPALLLGGGIRFSQPKWLTLSVGALLPLKKELSNLSPGDEVTGTA